MKSLWLLVFCVAFTVGYWGRTDRWFSYLHEYGHVLAAQQEGKRAVADSPYHTTINGDISFNILMGGFWMELLAWAGLSLVGALFTKDPITCGFGAGFATCVYVLAQMSEDFVRAGGGAIAQWQFYGLLTLAVMYFMVWRRFWRIHDRRLHHRPHGKYSNTE